MIIDTAAIFIILAVVTTILSLVFGGWILLSIVRGTFRLVLGPPGPSRRLPPASLDRQCLRRGCLTPNPPEARFCRHCGTPLAPARRAASSRAACW